MEAVPSHNNTYQRLGSVFTVSRGVLPGSGSAVPDDQSFDLAVIQFKDDGSFTDASQLKAATDCIEAARQQYGTGAIVVIFIHGWHHNARWDITTNDGDEHFKEFRRILMTLTLRELERRFDGEPGWRRVVGVYLSWNGDPENSLLSRIPILTHLPFWNRFCTAKRLGRHQAIHTAVAEIVRHTKATLTDLPESPLILIGHSMGALILESAFLALLREHPESLIQPSQPGQGRFQLPVRISIEDQPVTFPDLVLLLNSAAGSEVATDLSNGLKKVRKFVELGQIGFRLPLVISATSSQDFVTRILWRFGNWPWRKTEGHNSSLRTHTLVCTGEERRCLPKQDEHLAVSFGQAWHCLRWPPVKETDRPSFPIDLPKTMSLRENEQQKPQHIRYLLKPLGEINRRPQQGDPHPFWLVQLPPEISHDHNDIFNFRSSLLILALMQISGAVVSLAKKWEDAFEEETP